MTTAILLAWPFLGALVVLAWSRWLRHLKELEEAVKRHPAGRGRLDDHRPWDLPAPCCGGRIYGDSLPELLVNRAYHESMCPFTQRKAA